VDLVSIGLKTSAISEAGMAKAGDDATKALVDRAQAALKLDASAAAQRLAKANLERLASTLLLEWLVGDRRFESQSQQTEYWLSRFYEEIFIDEQLAPIIRESRRLAM
jgi:hypothetical protein